MIDRQHLAILREVNRRGSVTAAAEKLNVSQSALSHTIAKFEERHGVKIWTKTGKGLRLTQTGEYLLTVAERLLPQIEHAERIVKDFSVGRRGALRVGMECHPCQRWLTRIATPYLTRWPDVDFDVRTAFRFDGVAALLGYEIDLLITPDPLDVAELLFTPVFDYELVLMVQQDHPLAQRVFIQPEDLVDQELITVPVTLERLDIYTRFLVPANCRPRRHRTAETVDLMLQLVSAGRGVTVLPDWLLQEEGAGMPIKAISLGENGIRKSINVGLRRGDEEISFLKGFLELAQEASRSAA
ncbi:LysR family transcriptional regulator [Agrobacterium sp. P15N1-A]|uniref:LysR family transcriptional regulator n=1 Tax=Agrobacterium sp. P15N1-A TaxID=3342820 RepID=UPI0037CFC12A